MKKFILFIIVTAFFTTASAQPSVSVGVSFGAPTYGFRPMYHVPHRPIIAPRRIVYARPYPARRVVLVPASRSRRCRR